MAQGQKLVRVQTGPTSYIKMTEDEAKAYQAKQEQPAADASPDDAPQDEAPKKAKK